VTVNQVVVISGFLVSPVPVCGTGPGAGGFWLLGGCCALVVNGKREGEGMRVVCYREGELCSELIV
jgi:hypothetical protein